MWTKQGLIYKSAGNHIWNISHAQLPIVDMVDDMIWRIYYGSRDKENRTYTSFIHVEAGNPRNILYEHDKPILSLGKIGTFDDCGVMPSWILNVGKLKYLYYIGWTVRNTVPYHNSIGLAISSDGGRTFRKYSEGPLFSSTYLEPYFTGTSCVIHEDGVWRNWYLSCTKWEIIDDNPEPFYHLKYAESRNGIDWQRNGDIAIDYKDSDEGGIVKASVLREEGVYKMWFSFRKARGFRVNKENSYRIGYAESIDGKHWNRHDERASIDVSDEGWDSEMLAYPHVISYKNVKYLFYNGNNFGKSGFGYATEGGAETEFSV